jgi:uncharacterized protein YkwD
MVLRTSMIAITVTVIALLLSCKGGDDPITDALVTHGDNSLSASELQMIDRHNATRGAQGVGTLTANAQLNQIAQNQANYMADIGQYTHEDQQGGNVADRAQAVGYNYMRIAENVGYDISSEALYSGWLDSSGHLANIVHPDNEEIGVGRADRGIYQYWSVVLGAQ